MQFIRERARGCEWQQPIDVWDVHTFDSALVALDKHSGQPLWRASRDSTGCWTTPILLEAEVGDGVRTEIIVNGTGSSDGGDGWIIAYDPADGSELWRVQGTTDIVSPTAMAGGGLIFSTSGRNGPTIAPLRLLLSSDRRDGRDQLKRSPENRR